MKHDRFIGLVQDRAQLNSRGAAEVATRATLETLAERLAGNEPNNLAAQLPQGIADGLEQMWAGMGESFDLDEFYQRVSKRENVEVSDAAFHSKVVMTVLKEAVSEGEINDIRDQLLPDYAPLLEA
ncbi:MAG: DUF2267 domain-containing protein [Spirulinaceae cyanobacterium]